MAKAVIATICLMGLLVPVPAVWGQQVGLVGHWPLDEGAGDFTLDASGNFHDGTLMGDPQWTQGVFENALAFDGQDDYVELSHSARLNVTNQLTIAAWINASSFLNWAGVAVRAAGPGRGSAYGMQVWGDGALRFVANQLFGIQGGGGEWNSTGTMPLNEWTHAAITYNGRAIHFYINGEKDEREVDVSLQFGANDNPLIIGADFLGGQEFFHGSVDDVWLYERALIAAEIPRVMAGGAFNAALDPDPADGEMDVARDVLLSWSPGESAATHNVYFGTSLVDVNEASVSRPLGTLVSLGQPDTTLKPEGPLAFGQTYYWRVDEVNAPPDSTIFPGAVWRFTTEPFAYAVENIVATASSAMGPENSPQNAVNGSGLDGEDRHSVSAEAMWISQLGGPQPSWIQFDFDRLYRLHELWVWNSNQSLEDFFGIGIKGVSIELSEDGQTWTTFAEVELAQAPGRPDYLANNRVDLDGRTARAVRLTATSNWKGFVPQFSLSEVRFLHLPLRARRPVPVDGATAVDPGIDTLSWRAGREAVQHEILISGDMGSIADGSALLGRVEEARFDPAVADLQLDTQYFWRVTEVNEAAEPSSWPGDIWRFTTAPFIVIDDMESYADSPGLEIWGTWVDGFDDLGNGSLVGNGDSGVPETLIVHDGGQSMPLYYDNLSVATSSVTRVFDAPQDWTRGGARMLVLHVQGAPDNAGGQLYLAINDVKVPFSGNVNVLNEASWTAWIVDLTTVATDRGQVTSLSIGVEGGQGGVVFVDDIRLYKEAPAPAN